MKVRIVAVLAAVVALLASAAAAKPTTGPTAVVENIATVTSSNTTVFEFNVYDCPNSLITVTWDAEQPDRPGATVATAGAPFVSSGDRVEHLTVGTNGDFVPGHRWVGSGIVTCDAVVIPVEGAGTTKSLNGV